MGGCAVTKAQGRAGGGKRPSNNKAVIWVAVAAGAILAVGMIAASLTGQRSDSSGSNITASAGDTGDARRAKGNPNAPVILTMYSDFQCPYCAQADREAIRQIEKDYVANGKVYLVYKHFAFIGDESVDAAEASECAADQGKFWPYHDKLFASQAGENKGAFAPAKLKRFAQDLGLDMKAFNACFDSHKYRKQIEAAKKDAESIGVQTTPTFFVNGQMILGAKPYEEFKAVIEDELARAK